MGAFREVLDRQQAWEDVHLLQPFQPHIVPFQKPHPPIGVAGLSKKFGQSKCWRARLPADELNLNPGYVKSHWEAVEEGRSDQAGRLIG